MKNIKIVFIFLIISLIASCEKKEEEYTNEKPDPYNSQQNVKKDEPKQNQQQNTDSKKQEESTPEVIPDKTISAVEAKNYVGKFVVVQGLVVDIHKTENVEYLNFIEKYPDNPFEGVIFKGNFDAIGDLNAYLNKNVELTGLVSMYKGKPQIIINKKSQLKLAR